VLILVRAGAACAIGIPSLPAFPQVKELETALRLGAPRRIRTFGLGKQCDGQVFPGCGLSVSGIWHARSLPFLWDRGAMSR